VDTQSIGTLERVKTVPTQMLVALRAKVNSRRVSVTNAPVANRFPDGIHPVPWSKPRIGNVQSSFNAYFRSSQAQGLTGKEKSLPDQDPIDERPIRGAQVRDDHRLGTKHDLAMRTRDGLILDLEVITGASPDSVGSKSKLEMVIH
jgi:hypothetical protein